MSVNGQDDAAGLLNKAKTSGAVSPTKTLWLKVDEGAGITLADSSASANPGTAIGVPSLPAWTTIGGHPALAINNIGSSEYVAMTSTAGINPNYNQDWSISLWIKWISVVQAKAIFSALDPSANYNGWEMNYGDTTGDIVFYFVNNFGSGDYIEADFSGFSADTSTLWNIIFTYNGATHGAAGVNCYVNGTAITRNAVHSALTSTPAYSATPRIGQRADASYGIDANYQDIRFWKGTQLSAAQAAAIYAAGVDVDSP